jgi:signal transduction histidine kinase/ActR/RegA family two-component response regulator
VPLAARGAAGEPPAMRQRARIAPLTLDDGRIGTITVIDDVTERVAGEHELRRQIAAHHAARLDAEAAARAKDDFLAMLGHELRNPLAPILTALQLLKLRGIDAVERERAVIERQVKQLVILVDDLLDISRILRGTLEIRTEPVQVADFVAEAIEMSSPLLEQRRHELRVDVPRSGLLVSGDAHRLAQALSNLLTNSAKFTPPGGEISVSVEAAGDDVVVHVRDSGVGMDAELLSKAFEPFVQEQQGVERAQGGLGLGLAIVRNLVDLHGGSVSASSAGHEQGCEFTIRLPRLTAGLRAASSGDAAAAVSGAPRVLVVDDNHDAAELLAEMLSEVGYVVKFAFDGPSALRIAEGFAPDIAVLDIGLPVMDGYELAGRFQQHPRLARTRLVALTGYGQAQDRARAAEAGFGAHLVKPVDLEDMRRVLERLHPPPVGRAERRPAGDFTGARGREPLGQ